MPTETPAWRRPGTGALLLFFPPLAAALLTRGPWGLDELRLLQVVREMAARRAWIVPTLLGETYTHKPPLLLWIVRLLQAAGVDAALAPRLVSAAAAAGTILLFSALAKKLAPRGAGAAARALAVTPFFLLMAQLGTYDMALLFFLSAALYTSLRNQRAWFLPGLFTGLAVLTKGPVALLFLLFWVPSLKAALLGKRALRPGRPFFLFCLVFLAVLGAWFVPFSLATAGNASWAEALWRQSLGRIAGSQGFGHPRPFWFYLPLFPVLLLPWSWTLLRGLPPPAEGPAEPWKPWEWAVLLSSAGILLLFSCFRTKAPHYLLPLLPWFLLLLPRALEHLPPGEGQWLLWAGPPAGILLVLFGAGILDPLLAMARPGPLEVLSGARLPALLGGGALVLLPLAARLLSPGPSLSLLFTLFFLAAFPLLDRFQVPYLLVDELRRDPPRSLVVVHSRFGGSLTFLAGRAGISPPDPESLGTKFRGRLLGLGAPGVAAPILKGPTPSEEKILLLEYLSRPGRAALLTATYRKKLRLENTRLPVKARAFFRGEEILLLEKTRKTKKESSR